VQFQLQDHNAKLVGAAGFLPVPDQDEITRKLFMLVEGQCGELGPSAAAKKYGFSRPRYYQLLSRFQTGGAAALQSQRRGPKTHYRRTDQAVRQIIRHRFLDPEVTAAVIAQKLRQCDLPISQRSVARTLADYGLEKKTLRQSSPARSHAGAYPAHPEKMPRRVRRSP
jgi:transposase